VAGQTDLVIVQSAMRPTSRQPRIAAQYLRRQKGRSVQNAADFVRGVSLA
jgi:hypothetical protein